MAVVRYKQVHDVVGDTSSFNPFSVSEVIVYFPGGEATSEEISELEVLFDTGWIPMSVAFKTKKLIPDNYNRCFREPRNEQEYEKGWY